MRVREETGVRHVSKQRLSGSSGDPGTGSWRLREEGALNTAGDSGVS